MDILDILYIVIVVLAIAAIMKVISKKTDGNGRIKDKFVSVDNVLKALGSFKYESKKSLKFGYTEKSIQNQLKKHLQGIFVHVTDEYGIGGLNATKINFDIGHGKVGLELKLAKSLFKTANLHRLVGQIEDYKPLYKKGNLIVVLYGELEHTAERTHLKRIEEKLKSKSVHYAYYEILTD